MAQVAPDTPDYQRGVVSAQKLLATVKAGTSSVSVGLPPNCQTLVALFDITTAAVDASCTGNTTGIVYLPVAINTTDTANQSLIQYFDVAQSVDQDVTITLAAAPAADWYVYADSAVRVTVDPRITAAIYFPGYKAPANAILIGGTDGTHMRAIRTTQDGVPYSIPSAPSTLTGDHPPVELAVASGIVTGAGTLIAAPGTGKRIRVRSALASPQGSYACSVSDSAGGVYLSASAPGIPSFCDWGPTGIPLTEDLGVTCNSASSGTSVFTVTYTIETI